jgi:very-short-patch-repair endonuclease
MSGGYKPIEKTCNRCNTSFFGVWNKSLCIDCETHGYDHICANCNIQYIDTHRYRKYCCTCTTNRVWQKHKSRPIDVRKKITNSKLEYYQTQAGQETAKSVGNQNSIKLKEFYQTPEGVVTKQQTGKKLSKIMKDKILRGEFTPKITNTFTHWTAEIEIGNNIRKFRSSWEAVLWYSNQHWEYETIRIPYIDKNNESKTYIVDFYDPKNQVLIEVKPKSNIKDNQYKIDAAKKYCLENNIEFLIISEDTIQNYINETIFDGRNKLQLNKCYATRKRT